MLAPVTVIALVAERTPFTATALAPIRPALSTAIANTNGGVRRSPSWNDWNEGWSGRRNGIAIIFSMGIAEATAIAMSQPLSFMTLRLSGPPLYALHWMPKQTANGCRLWITVHSATAMMNRSKWCLCGPSRLDRLCA